MAPPVESKYIEIYRVKPDMRYVNESRKVVVEDPHPAPDQYQNLFRSRGPPLVHAYAMFGRRLLMRS